MSSVDMQYIEISTVKKNVCSSFLLPNFGIDPHVYNQGRCVGLLTLHSTEIAIMIDPVDMILLI